MERTNRLIKMLLVVLALYLAGGEAFAAGSGKGNGRLTSIGQDGTVVINEKVYVIDIRTRVMNAEEKQVSLRDLLLPAPVYYEYNDINQVPLIYLLREMPR